MGRVLLGPVLLFTDEGVRFLLGGLLVLVDEDVDEDVDEVEEEEEEDEEKEEDDEEEDDAFRVWCSFTNRV